MSITRYSIAPAAGVYSEDPELIQDPEGNLVDYEDFLVSVATLNHIIDALNGQLADESLEIQRLKDELVYFKELAGE